MNAPLNDGYASSFLLTLTVLGITLACFYAFLIVG